MAKKSSSNKSASVTPATENPKAAVESAPEEQPAKVTIKPIDLLYQEAACKGSATKYAIMTSEQAAATGKGGLTIKFRSREQYKSFILTPEGKRWNAAYNQARSEAEHLMKKLNMAKLNGAASGGTLLERKSGSLTIWAGPAKISNHNGRIVYKSWQEAKDAVRAAKKAQHPEGKKTKSAPTPVSKDARDKQAVDAVRETVNA